MLNILMTRFATITPLSKYTLVSVTYRLFSNCSLFPYAALPHYTTADDEYKGYHIPAGTLVFANIW